MEVNYNNPLLIWAKSYYIKGKKKKELKVNLMYLKGRQKATFVMAYFENY
jgi:hypothetical protein